VITNFTTRASRGITVESWAVGKEEGGVKGKAAGRCGGLMAGALQTACKFGAPCRTSGRLPAVCSRR